METVRLTMGQALIRFLDNQYIEFDGQESKFVEGVWGIFGHGCVVGIGEALEESNHGLKFYQGKSEQGMAQVAVAYAKQHNRRKMMAVVSSIGPGALNMVTAAGVATVNRIPTLFLPGDAFACRQPDPVLQQVELSYDSTITANDAFKPVSKYWDRITRPEQLMTAAVHAMRVLTDPAETGAVTLALPQDVQGEAYDYPVHFFAKRVHRIGRRQLEEDAAERAAELIASSRKPIIICGGGVRYSEAGQALADFAERFNIPFGESQSGKGTVRWDHAMNLGGIGATGSLAANTIAHEADLVIAVGTRLNDFTTASKSNFHNPDVRLMALNVNGFDACKLNAEPFVADARAGLEAIGERLQAHGYSSGYTTEIQAAKEVWNQEVDRLYNLESEAGYAQTRVLGQLNEKLLPADAIIVAAAGSLPADLQRLWRPRVKDTYHIEFGTSCMGYEVPAALGAKLAAPNQEVYCLLGDGSYMMLHSELHTAVQEGQKVNIVLLDNHGFHCIDNLQTSQGIPSFGCQFLHRDPETGRLTGEPAAIDFAANARSYGCEAWTATNPEELEQAMTEARKSKVSTLIHVKVLAKSMTEGYSSWWRVGTAEVSEKPAVEEAARQQKEAASKALPY